MWDLKQRNFFCVRLRPHSLWTQAGKRSTLGCGCRDSLYTGLGAALLSLPMSLSSGSRHRGGERVTYLDLLNSFHQWQKSNYLPGNARLLYYGLLAVFNEARWPEQVQIDNFRLMSMLETVVLLSRKTPDDTIEVDLDLDELDITAAESKATYQEIKDYVLKEFGLKVSTLYISQIKRKCGIDVGEHYNISQKENQKVPQCPKEKEDAIRAALEHFAMI